MMSVALVIFGLLASQTEKLFVHHLAGQDNDETALSGGVSQHFDRW
jgi:hypothetical protein